MAHALADADSFAAAVTVPDDTDAASAASVGLPFQNLADRSRYLKNRSLGAKGGILRVNLAAPLYNCHSDYSAGVHFALPAAAPLTPIPGCWTQSDVAQSGRLGFDITEALTAAGCLGATISAVTATIDGDLASATPPHANIPAGAPTARLVSMSTATAVMSVQITATDTSADAATYDAAHSFTAAGACVVSAGNRYIVEFTGETGGNSEAGMTLLDLYVTVTP